MNDWIDLSEYHPNDNQLCHVRFNDGTKTHGRYWAHVGIFLLDENDSDKVITHWMKICELEHV